MKYTPTMRNYLVAVHELSLQNRGRPVSTGNIATFLGVTPGTATSMVKQLSDLTLLKHKPYRGAELTNEGKKLAVKIVRRRDILRRFLIETLKIANEHAQDEAVKLEPQTSDRLISQIEKRVH